jgi:hypothetical protein
MFALNGLRITGPADSRLAPRLSLPSGLDPHVVSHEAAQPNRDAGEPLRRHLLPSRSPTPKLTGARPVMGEDDPPARLRRILRVYSFLLA